MKVLISFIGTGKKAQGEGKKEYIKARYLLPDGSFQDSSLVSSVLYNYLKPDKLVVIGTPDSIWSELYWIAPQVIEKKLYEKIFDLTWDENSKMDSDTLKEWENLLSQTLGKPFKLYLIDSDDREAKDIFKILYDELPENSNVFLDITHAFRHFPMIAAFSLPVLRYLKNFNKLTLVYGKLNTFPEFSPVIFIETPTRLIELLEAVSLVEHSGNFAKFEEIFQFPEIRNLYLKVETNRKISNSQFNKLIKKLRENKERDFIDKVTIDFLNEKVFKEVKGDTLALRMAKRALFFAEREQFLKAYTLIFEALVNTQSSVEDYNTKKKKLEKSLDGIQKRIYHTIREIRNTIVHGSEPPKQSIAKIIENSEELKRWVLEGYKLVKSILENK